MPSQAIWSTYCPRKLRRGSRPARCRKKPPSSRTRCRCSRRTGRTVGQTWEALCPRTRAVPSSSLPARERSAPVRSWSRPSRRTDASRPWGRKREGHENVSSVRVAVCVWGGFVVSRFVPSMVQAEAASAAHLESSPATRVPACTLASIVVLFLSEPTLQAAFWHSFREQPSFLRDIRFPCFGGTGRQARVLQGSAADRRGCGGGGGGASVFRPLTARGPELALQTRARSRCRCR